MKTTQKLAGSLILLACAIPAMASAALVWSVEGTLINFRIYDGSIVYGKLNNPHHLPGSCPAADFLVDLDHVALPTELFQMFLTAASNFNAVEVLVDDSQCDPSGRSIVRGIKIL